MYFIISFNGNMIETFINYCRWLFLFLIGDYGLDSQSRKILFWDFSNDSSKLAIGPKYMNTLSLSFISIIVCFILSSILNYFTIIRKSIIALFIKICIEWLSSIHIIIICLFVLSFFETNVPYLFAILMICLGTNAFFEISSAQFSDMKDLNSKAFSELEKIETHINNLINKIKLNKNNND